MRRLVVSTFLTLDGVVQAPRRTGEDDDAGFAHGGWSVSYGDERRGEVMPRSMGVPFDTYRTAGPVVTGSFALD